MMYWAVMGLNRLDLEKSIQNDESISLAPAARGTAVCLGSPAPETYPSGGSVIVPSGYVKIAIENGPLIVDLPMKDGDF